MKTLRTLSWGIAVAGVALQAARAQASIGSLTSAFHLPLPADLSARNFPVPTGKAMLWKVGAGLGFTPVPESDYFIYGGLILCAILAFWQHRRQAAVAH